MTVVVAAVLAMLSVPLGAAGAATGHGAAVAAPRAVSCGGAPDGHVSVAMVVDRAPHAPSVRCVVLPDRATGLDALRAAGHTVRLDGGFVCAIDGFPATGCATDSSFDGGYWRYWHAPIGSPWQYSQVGAGGYRLPKRCAVDGWVWSTSRSQATPPSIAPPAVSCDVPVATTVPAPAPPPTATPAPPGNGGAATGAAPGGPAGGVPSPAPGVGTPAVPSAPAGDVGVATPDQGAPGAQDPSTVPAGGPAAPAGGDDPGAEAAGEAVLGTEQVVGSDDTDTDVDDGAGGSDAQRSEQAAASGAGDTSSSPVGVFIAVALVAVIAGGAVIVRRRARGDEPTANA